MLFWIALMLAVPVAPQVASPGNPSSPPGQQPIPALAAQASATTIGAPCIVGSSEWAYTWFGTFIGSAGIVIGDFNGNGAQEIVFSGDNQSWQVIERNGNDYSTLKVGPTYVKQFLKLFIQTPPVGPPLLCVAFYGGDIYFYDLVSYAYMGHAYLEPVNGYDISEIVVVDLEGDGRLEYVTSRGIDLLVYSAAAPYALVKTYPLLGGYKIAVGNFDTDPSVEIATSITDIYGAVIDGQTGLVQWNFNGNFGENMMAADIDGDGIEEVVGLRSFYVVTAFDVDLESVKWTRSISDPSDMIVADSDGDNIAEVIVHERVNDEFSCFDGTTGQTLWTLPTPRYRISKIAMADVDQDKVPELLWGTKEPFPPNQLFIADPTKAVIEWASLPFIEYIESVSYGDLNNDKRPEFLACIDGMILIFDGASRSLIHKGLLGVNTNLGSSRIAVGDVDNDGDSEFLVAANDNVMGVIQIYDGATFSKEWEINLPASKRVGGMVLTNLDDDPQLEILIGESTNRSGSASLRAYDGALRTLEWETPPQTPPVSGLTNLLVKDLDGDGALEIVATASNQTTVFDAKSHEVKAQIPQPAMCLTTANLDDDAALELVIGWWGGKAYIFDGADFSPQHTITFFDPNTIVYGIQMTDTDGDDRPEWVVLSKHELLVVDPATNLPLWSPDDCSNHQFIYQALEPANLDDDPAIEVLLGQGVGINLFELRSCTEIPMMVRALDWPITETVITLLKKRCP